MTASISFLCCFATLTLYFMHKVLRFDHLIHVNFNRWCLCHVEIFPLHHHRWIRLDHFSKCIRSQCQASFRNVECFPTYALWPLYSVLFLQTSFLDCTALARYRNVRCLQITLLTLRDRYLTCDWRNWHMLLVTMSWHIVITTCFGRFEKLLLFVVDIVQVSLLVESSWPFLFRCIEHISLCFNLLPLSFAPWMTMYNIILSFRKRGQSLMILWVVTGLLFSRVWNCFALEVAVSHLSNTEVVDNVGRSLQNDETLGCGLAVVCFRRRYLLLDIELIHIGRGTSIVMLVFQRILSAWKTVAILGTIEHLNCRVLRVWCNLIARREEIFWRGHILWSAFIIDRLVRSRNCAMLIWVFVFGPFRILDKLLFSYDFHLFVEAALVLRLILLISLS